VFVYCKITQEVVNRFPRNFHSRHIFTALQNVFIFILLSIFFLYFKVYFYTFFISRCATKVSVAMDLVSFEKKKQIRFSWLNLIFTCIQIPHREYRPQG